MSRDHQRRIQNILEQLLRWRFDPKSEKVDERQMVLTDIQMEAEGKTAGELADELGLDENDLLAGLCRNDQPQCGRRLCVPG